MRMITKRAPRAEYTSLLLLWQLADELSDGRYEVIDTRVQCGDLLGMIPDDFSLLL